MSKYIYDVLSDLRTTHNTTLVLIQDYSLTVTSRPSILKISIYREYESHLLKEINTKKLRTYMI